MDILVVLHRRLQKVVDHFGVRTPAQKVFRWLYARKNREGRPVRVVQNGREWWLHPEVALRGEFAEFETVEWLRQVIKPGNTVIDVGANIGQMTLEMASLVGPTGKVFAVEPSQGNLRLLRQHVDANGYSDRVIIVEAACSDVDGGSVELRVFGDSADTVGSGHTLVLDRKLSETEQKIPTVILRVNTISLDGLCARFNCRPQVIKIDVEGAELLVLRGSHQVLTSCRPSVRFGFHPFAFKDPLEGTRQIREFLTNHGYQIADGVNGGIFELAEYSAAAKSNS